MRLRLVSTTLILLLGCSSSQRVESADEAEVNRSAGSAPDAEPNPNPQRPADGGLLRIPYEPPLPLVGPLIETACQATKGDRKPLEPACAAGCTARTGGMLDRENQCVVPVVFACIPTIRNEASVASCFKRVADGRIVLTGAVPHDLAGPAWTSCSSEDWADWPDTECN